MQQDITLLFWKKSLPKELEIIAETNKKIIMGNRSQKKKDFWITISS